LIWIKAALICSAHPAAFMPLERSHAMFHRLFKGREQRSLLFGKMLRRFSFNAHRDITSSEAATLNQAISRCRACGATDHCQTWMDSTDGTEGADQFCPNVQAFKELAGPKKS
jgi:hypothetical protein